MRTYSSDEVIDYLDSIATEGEYLDNQYYDIGQYDSWELKKIPISAIDFSQENVSSDDSQELIARYKNLKSEAPPIIVIPQEEGLLRIVDGYHRVAIADLKGQTHIMAYIPEQEIDEEKLPYNHVKVLVGYQGEIVSADEGSHSVWILNHISDLTDDQKDVLRKRDEIYDSFYKTHPDFIRILVVNGDEGYYAYFETFKDGPQLEQAVLKILNDYPGIKRVEVVTSLGTKKMTPNEYLMGEQKDPIEQIVEKSYSLFEAAKISGIDYRDYLALLLFTDAFLDIAQKEHPAIAEKVTEPGVELVESVWDYFEKNDMDMWTFVDRRPAYAMVKNLNEFWQGKVSVEDLVRFDEAAFGILALQAVGRDVSLEDNRKVKAFLSDRGVEIPTIDDLGIELDTKRYEAAYKAIEALRDKETEGLKEEKEHPYIRQAYDLLRLARNKVDSKRMHTFDRILYDLEDFV